MPRPTSPTIYAVQGWRRACVWPLAAVMRAWGASIHFQLDARTRETLRPRVAAAGEDTRACVFILWHNRLWLAAEIARRWRKGRVLHGLISASKDGAWLAAFFAAMGLGAIRGSSSRGGREAATALVEALRAGHDAGITPDGPRGPCYECKPGAIIVARRAEARALIVGIAYEHAWRLRSWDRLALPQPFSTVRLIMQEAPPELLHSPEAVATLRARLLALNPDEIPSTGSACVV
jgi:lysophospholipid acyltransferase (LPLAT)-like uncharacterized protein